MKERNKIHLDDVMRPDGLLSCPFCGRDPEYMARASSSTDSGEYHALFCYCGGFSSTVHHGAESQAEVVALWNRRTHPSAAEPVLEIRACGCSQAKEGRCVMGDYGALPVGTKLYADTPRPVAEPARQKLTAAQVRRLYDNCPSEARDAKSFAAFRRIVALVESVHQMPPRPKRPCHCGPDGCADSVSCPRKGGAA